MRIGLLLVALPLLGCTSSSGSLTGGGLIDGGGGVLLDDDDAVDDDDATDDDDVAADVPALVVNELMSDNDASWFDDRGEPTDWLEVHNPGDEDVDLMGWTVSDDWTQPDLHVFEASVVVPADGVVLLYASGEPDFGPRHLSFNLSRRGEAVGLFDPQGRSIDWVQFPALGTDTAYARVRDAGTAWTSLEDGTPGRSND